MTCNQPSCCSPLKSEQWSLGQKEMFHEREFSDQRMSQSGGGRSADVLEGFHPNDFICAEISYFFFFLEGGYICKLFIF